MIMKLKTVLQNLALVFATILIAILLLEGGMQAVRAVKKMAKRSPTVSGGEIGWRNQPPYAGKRNVKGYGELYVSLDTLGFRVFGDLKNGKTKILVLGDSFTEGFTVSDGKTYYDYLATHHDSVEIFAYGCSGYGSLQEFMILDQYVDQIEPDLIIWQFCANDLINNSLELETLSLKHNNLSTRPYYINGQTVQSFPVAGGVWRWVVQHSRLFRTIYQKLNILKNNKNGSIEDKLTRDHPLLLASQKTTTDIMTLVKNRIGEVPVVTFSVDTTHEWVFKEIAAETDIAFIDGIPQAVQAAKESGVSVDGLPYNYHWNDKGNAIAGEIILDYLVRENMIGMNANLQSPPSSSIPDSPPSL